jgi:hypothetical protein
MFIRFLVKFLFSSNIFNNKEIILLKIFDENKKKEYFKKKYIPLHSKLYKSSRSFNGGVIQ